MLQLDGADNSLRMRGVADVNLHGPMCVGKIVFVVREGVFHCKTCVKFPNLQTMTLAHLY